MTLNKKKLYFVFCILHFVWRLNIKQETLTQLVRHYVLAFHFIQTHDTIIFHNFMLADKKKELPLRSPQKCLYDHAFPATPTSKVSIIFSYMILHYFSFKLDSPVSISCMPLPRLRLATSVIRALTSKVLVYRSF